VSTFLAKNFGLLEYPGTDNLGDEIQSLAAKRFLPRVSQYLNREALHTVNSRKGGKLWTVMNGWYCHIPSHWPPSDEIEPLYVAVHISEEPTESGVKPRDVILSDDNIAYLRKHAPIGARDINTLRLLRNAGVESYFSGCVTLTLQRPRVERRDGIIVLNDVSDKIVDFVRGNTDKEIIRTTHSTQGENNSQKRFARAQQLLALYSAASCVITSRLHCAMPCLALGTPVLFLSKVHDQYRFSGLQELANHCSADQWLTGQYSYDLRSLPPNPTHHLLYRRRLSERVRAFVETEEP
jgi:hypothetical protein